MTTARTISLDTLAATLRGPSLEVVLPGSGTEPPLVLVDLDASDQPVVEAHGGFPMVIVGLTSSERPELHPAVDACDVALRHGDPALDAVIATVTSNPFAATALALVLRGGQLRSVDDGLQLESAVYSALQAGQEFAAWRAGRPRREREEAPDAVAIERHGDSLEIVLARPHVRNALNSVMRDQLADAFRLVAMDPSITEVHLRGAGPSFCAGGDLDEFGSFPDPATAHLIRLQQSVGRAIHAVRARVTAHLHGACMGSGIELPAFAGTVVGDPSTTIGLPEVGLGLIPGAGGTVSLPRRIGRHRTARLALTGDRLDATAALDCGLIDAIEPAAAP